MRHMTPASLLTLKPTRNPNVTQAAATLAAANVIVTQMLDAASTTLGLALGAEEQNPVMAALIESSYGIPGFWALKLASGVFLAWYSWKRPAAAAALALIFGGVAAWNISATLAFAL